jgi:Tol biopolymer transport system component
MIKKSPWILFCIFLIVVWSQILSQTKPTPKELKALKSIRGKIAGSIVWSTSRHGSWQIYKMNADGTGKVRLTNDKQSNYHPVWSKHGKWIYYQRNNDIYRMLPDGSDSQIVVKDGFAFNISGDGLSLIYVVKERNGKSLVFHGLESGKKEEIIPARIPEFEGKEILHPTISPDGNWLAFISDYPRTWTIHTAKLDGSDLYQYAFGCMPQYRPDGLRLAWISTGSHNIYIGTLDGKDKELFENSIPRRPHCYFPRWSNDGEYIVFAAGPRPDTSTSDYEICIKSIRGGEAVRLTFNKKSDIWPDLFIPEKRKSR